MLPARSALVHRQLEPERRLRRPAANPTPAPAGPFLKWAGGKARLLTDLTARAPSSFNRYFEPFLGGGALFFGLAPSRATLSDSNAELVACYRAVRDDVETVIDVLAVHTEKHCQEHFYDLRARWNAGLVPPGSVGRAAAFIYLNKTGYNGLWRVNSKGDFNVPMGRYAKPAILDEDKLRAAARALAGVKLEPRPFEDVLDEASAGDFVYFDPPYDPTSRTANFVSYTSAAFGRADQTRLAELFAKLAHRGCHVMLSNSDTPFIRELYRDFRIDRVYCSRAINSRSDARGAVAEVIVTSNV